jgi:type II secretory pathway pseudopilin PulG
MLIVIVIIGILAAALVPRLQAVQGRARDTKRKADLRTIYNALEVYIVDNGKYVLPSNGYTDCPTYGQNCSVHSSQLSGNIPWISGLTNIITSVPVDPINNGAPTNNTGNYSYSYGRVYDSPNTYDLITTLENSSDPDRCAVKQYKWNNDNSSWCASSFPWRANLFDMSPNVANQ